MRDPILLTPGPLTTTLATKTAMLHDYGSWDADFNRLTATVCDQLLAIIQPAEQEFVCVPLQGSGTFAVEAAIGSLMPRDGKLLVLVNGAYGKRMAQLTQMMGRACAVIDAGETSAIDPEQVRSYLADHPEITHVGVIYVETSTGILNPLPQIAEIVQAAGKRLIIDAMSAFGALPLDIVVKGLAVGSTLTAGSFLAKRFVLKLDPGHFRLLMDALMLASGAILLGAALA